MFHVDRIEIPDTAHTVVETATSRVVDLCASRATAEATCFDLACLYGVCFHCRPTDRADLRDLYEDFVLVAR